MTMRSRLVCAAALLLLPSGAAAQGEAVRLLGEVRIRGEADRPAGFDSVDAFSLLRSRLGVEAVLSPRALVLLQVQDARTLGEEANTLDGSADRLDMHQAWLQYRFDAGAYGVSVRAGRQEIALGNERLVGAVGWSNTGRAFDGVRVTAGPGGDGWKLNAFATTIRERGRRFTGMQPDRADHLFGGGYLVAGPADLFVLHDREDAFRTYAAVNRTTLGGRLHSAIGGGVSGSLEAAGQLGSQRTTGALQPVSQDIRAYMAGGRVAWETPVRTVPRVGLGVDWLSGDDQPGDGSYRAFQTLYATNHRYYGYIDLFLDPAARTADRGLVNGIASARIGLPWELALDLDGHGFWLHQQFATAPDRFLGWELDLTLPIRLAPGQELHLGYSLFRNGAAAPLIGLGRDGLTWHWAYVQASFAFGGRIAPTL
jgi:hypothetical protein